MSVRTLFRASVCCLLILTATLFGADPQLLKTGDVSKVMQQIFDQHVDKKEMTGIILKNSFRIYIDQFDPDRIYLLDDEVHPFLAPTGPEVEAMVAQYKDNDFSSYQKLNTVIQKAIERARKVRAELQQNPDPIFQQSRRDLKDKGSEWLDPDLKRPFAKSQPELNGRIKEDLVKFFVAEERRYGEASVANNQAKALNLYDKHLRTQEDTYLYKDDAGKEISAAEKENLFVMHVLKALAGSLDAHTSFFNPTEAYDMKVRLEKEFQGIGVVLLQGSDGSVVVSKLVDGGPAAKSGLVKPNDKIVEIDGKKLADQSFDKVMDMIRGKNGSTITLVLKRPVDENDGPTEKLFTVKLKREPIVVNDDRVETRFERVGNGIIGVITLHSFYQGDNGVTSENDVRDAIKKLDKEGNLRGLILDLRDNSGGFLSQAVKVAGLFITDGIIVISKYFNGEQHIYRDIDSDDLYSGPMIILTSRATASAAEIVAQALQDYGVAIIVGDDRTYGKGTIQSQTVTGDGSTSYFKVTVGKYYTVSGNTPQIQGVRADVVVPSVLSNEHIGEEYLDYALPSDKITAEYKDSLTDIDPNLKQWYMKYYVPHEQKKEEQWRSMIPTLKKNSSFRIGHNPSYQNLLNRLNGNGDTEKAAGGMIISPAPRGDNSLSSDDLQMAEAVNIVKDMIFLQTHARGGGIVDFSGQPAQEMQEAAK